MKFTPAPWLRHGFWLTVLLSVAAGIQGMLPNFFDGDTGYHLAVARLTREYGILQAFPWTPFSWLADHYADKELLFHWLLVPVAGLDPNTAARIAGTLLGATLLATLYFLLVKERVTYAGWWAILPLAASSAFIYRFALVRPHLLSIPLALLISWSAARKRWFILGGACFIYPLCYTAWHLPVALILIVEGARWISDRRVEWRTVLVSLSGLAAGIVIHPNFPANVELFWIQNVTVLVSTVWADRTGFEMGREYEPFTLAGLVLYALLPAVLTAMAAWRKRSGDVLPLALVVTAICFVVLTLRTQRFIEYLAPYAVFALAISWRPPTEPRLAPALVAVGIVWIGLFARYPIELLRMRAEAFPAPVAAALRAAVPEGEQVVTCDWQFTGEMMLALPDRKFIVALDPVFFAMNDSDLYQLWFETIHEPLQNSGTILREGFEARYVLCRHIKQWSPLLQSLKADSNVKFKGVHGMWALFELLEAPGRG